jgi:DNA topoisomerase II
MAKKLEDKYKKLSHREHVLKRKNMYCGSPNSEDTELFVVDDIKNLDDIKISKQKVSYNPAFIKLFDEVISNAGDFHIRTGNVSNIKVTVDETTISVENDGGGIPIEIHPVEKVYVPEMIFGHLLTGENYDDDEEKMGAGQNGLGVKLVNILSNDFTIETADGKKSYKQTFTNNMSVVGKAKIKESPKKFTKVTYSPDFTQFNGVDSISDEIKSIILKRVLDLAVYLPDVKFTFNGKVIKMKSMKDFMKLHLPEDAELFYEKLSNGWEVGIAKSTSEMFNQISICSSVSTYRGGTHVNHVSNELSKDLAEMITKGNKKLKISWVDVKNKLFLFLIAKVPNPSFDTQTKENLINYIGKDIHQGAKISDNTLKKIMKSEIVQSIMDYIKLKEQQELKRIQGASKKLKIAKLVDAEASNRSECELFIFEGESAGDSCRKFRDPQKQAIFKLRGKFSNILKMSDRQIVESDDVLPLMNTIGLELNKKATKDSLRFKKILIACDMDVDGDSIVGMLLNFFSRWKEVFDMDMIYRVITPLLVIKKGKDKKYFYTDAEWLEYKGKNSLNGWEVFFKKGLGSLNDEEYSDMIKNAKTIQIHWDKDAMDNLKSWFGDDSGLRKDKLM